MKIHGKSFLAPMAGISNNPGFLYLCKKNQCEVIILPMIFCRTVVNYRKYLNDLLGILIEANKKVQFQPLIIQIIGNSEDLVKKTCDILSSYKISGVNLNLGCPSRKMKNLNIGAYLLKSPKKCKLVIETLAKHSPAPPSIKIRLLGPKTNKIKEKIDFCKDIDDLGLDFIAIHGRTLEQGYSGQSNWKAIKKIHQAVKTPIVGNGDLRSRQEGMKRIENGACEAFMIGRSAMKNPKAFDPNFDPDNHGKDIYSALSLFQEHVNFLKTIKSPLAHQFLTLYEKKRWMIFYSKGTTHGRALRSKISAVKTDLEFDNVIQDLINNSRSII
ncbi:MAG: tRNA-dihydrouridine synthase family protein [Promethearchaeota archaeon]